LKDPATRGGSLAMHERVNEGDVLALSTPRNHFALAHDAQRSLLLAGGIGITPILCMAERLAIVGEAFAMHYCTRAPEHSATPVTSETDGSFDVRLASSGRVIAVAADRSVLAALADAGVVVPSSCEQGVCGTCLTRVIEGTPDHRDQYLMPDEQAANDQFLPCCSRAKSARLVLDL